MAWEELFIQTAIQAFIATIVNYLTLKHFIGSARKIKRSIRR